ncbi:unnamed protein product [Kuraishia capsulata CBS 1993]|uniref:Uncharacterized protein n=1 Tax=Kuraishia capsulata CBS 1993 TaxID=1382522 RepID=W6MRZ3_9ASCO|nr:uncharacterized protein KUCA_T00000561001 [Kuraishia capsulata CBS 1993]CDK24595.1 unnamed protein product [Kuraishia capsulata CBS 1993]
MIDIQPTSPRRVKVYSLQGDRWIDRGTGYCSGELDAETERPIFIVRNEQDDTEVLLKAPIEGTTQYQKQQDTLIVWTDPDGNDFALSFQELEGCYSICDFLISVQQNIEPNISLVAVVPVGSDGEITEMIAGPVPPPPEPKDENLPEVLDYLNQGSKTTFFRESISKFIDSEGYLSKLVDAFNRNEKGRNLTNLHYLCDIIKTLVFYNDTNILEQFLDDNIIIGVVGILEYDPDFPSYKSNNREYISDETKFKEVIPLNDQETSDIIKKTFRLQFLKDVVLARLLDDATFGWIATLIYFNQVKIIKFLNENEHFLSSLFAMYQGDDYVIKDGVSDEAKNEANRVLTPKSDGSCSSPSNGDADADPQDADELLQKKRDGIRLVHQFVIVAKGLQATARSQFYSALVKRGLFKLIGFAFKDIHTSSRVLATELIVSIVEHDVLLINGTQPATDDIDEMPREDEFGDENSLEIKERFLSDDMTLFALLTFILLEEEDIGLKTQVSEALKVLLHPSPSTVSSANLSGGSLGPSSLNTTNYLTAFYSKVSPSLFEPLVKVASLALKPRSSTPLSDSDGAVTAVPSSSSSEESKFSSLKRHESVLHQNLCELVSLCASEHEKHLSRSFFLENDVLLGVSYLVNPVFPLQTRLGAVRCLKSILVLNDEFYTRYIINMDVLKPVVELLKETNNSNNLANSCCLDLLNTLIRGDANGSVPNNRFVREYLLSQYEDTLMLNFLGRELVQKTKLEKKAKKQEEEEDVISDEDLGGNTMTSPDPDYGFGDATEEVLAKVTPEKRLWEESDEGGEAESEQTSKPTGNTGQSKKRQSPAKNPVKDSKGKLKREKLKKQNDKKKVSSILKSKFAHAGAKLLNMKKED